MKIFMYSDLHISKTSSIFPLTSKNHKYTYRQNMIIELGKYLSNLIDELRPDLIVNLGDTFDQHTVTSYDIDVASEFFKCFRYLNIPHLVLVGNHEMINADFNAIKILSNINNITVITEPTKTGTSTLLCDNNNNEQISLAFMPYMESRDITEFPDGDFLFSHLDIMGMKIRGDYEMETGVTSNQLSKYKLVFNGHIHKSSIKGNVINVGSISTHSFSDDNDSVPQCYIFDTDTLNLTSFKPTMCPLFRKFEIKDDLSELHSYISGLDSNYKYILQVSCPFDLKEDVKQELDNSNNVIASRLNVRADKTKKAEENVDIAVESNVDVKKSFIEFLDTTDLKYPKDLYLEVLGGI